MYWIRCTVFTSKHGIARILAKKCIFVKNYFCIWSWLNKSPKIYQSLLGGIATPPLPPLSNVLEGTLLVHTQTSINVNKHVSGGWTTHLHGVHSLIHCSRSFSRSSDRPCSKWVELSLQTSQTHNYIIKPLQPINQKLN